jgi:hypothetical protein
LWRAGFPHFVYKLKITFKNRRKIMATEFWVYEAIKGVPEGERYDTAVRLVGRWYNRYLTCEEVAILLIMWNERNLPPMAPQQIRSIYNSTKKWRKPWLGEDE